IMTWCSGLALVGAVAGCGQPVAVRTAGSRAVAIGSWGRAITVPGLGALNKGRNAGVLSVSCPSPGNCAAVGDYRDGGRHQQGFVVSERNERWHLAIEAPGLGALNKGGDARVSSVSCASPGYCAAVGYYRNHGRQGFVVSERNGRWSRAVEVPGLGVLNRGGNAEVSSVSCVSQGYCAAAGFYRDGNGRQQGFVAIEQNGVWGRAVEVPGLGFLNKGGNARVSSVSCASPGNCTAGGDYTSDASGRLQAFVVSEMGGSWGTAQEVAGNLNTGPGLGAFVDTVSCGSAGNCAVGGSYDGPGNDMFVISEVNGSWGSAQEVAGNLYVPGGGTVDSVSCASAGNCSAGGTYDYGGYNAAFLVSEKNGVWGQGINVPGLSKVARDAYLTSVSCASAGNCAAGGSYDGGGSGAWVVRETNGVWGKETTVPGLGALNKGSVLGVSSVSCASAGSCVAGGYYQETGRYALQGFVT
ncbi:MAG TPA: hypothetical protein VF940_19145, partial [Streptosporangiaceae bacterium]